MHQPCQGQRCYMTQETQLVGQLKSYGGPPCISACPNSNDQPTTIRQMLIEVRDRDHVPHEPSNWGNGTPPLHKNVSVLAYDQGISRRLGYSQG